MLILNFSHPLTDAQLDHIAEPQGIAPQDIEDRRIPVQLDLGLALSSQIERLADQVTGMEIGALINLPGYSMAAALLVQVLKKRFGGVELHLLRLRPVAGVAGTSYEVAEIIVV